jgi:hypothetical protein
MSQGELHTQTLQSATVETVNVEPKKARDLVKGEK